MFSIDGGALVAAIGFFSFFQTDNVGIRIAFKFQIDIPGLFIFIFELNGIDLGAVDFGISFTK